MLNCEHIFFTYGETRAHGGAVEPLEGAWTLHDIDFTLENGSFFGIAGPTGSGKSTLLQLSCGLLHPARGRMAVDGIDLSDGQRAYEARLKVGFAFQYPERQLFAATLYEDIAFGPRNLGFSRAKVKESVEEAMERVGLAPEFAQRNPFSLSGGQRRRAALAGILAMHPSTLVLDEPAAGLDPYSHDRIFELIESLHRTGLTIMMASHNMDDLAKYCSEMLVLDNGGIVAQGTPASVFADENVLTGIGLEAPHTQRLARDLRATGIELPEQFYDIDSLAAAIIAARG